MTLLDTPSRRAAAKLTQRQDRDLRGSMRTRQRCCSRHAVALVMCVKFSKEGSGQLDHQAGSGAGERAACGLHPYGVDSCVETAKIAREAVQDRRYSIRERAARKLFLLLLSDQ
jgi:hypothetical protein